MKTRIIILSALLGAFPANSRAIFGVGDVVFDPSNNYTAILNQIETMAQWAEAIIRYEQMIQNGIKQIQEAKNMVKNTKTILTRVGDWKQVYDRYQDILMETKNLTKWQVEGFENAIDYGQNGYYSKMAQNAHITLKVPATMKGIEVIIDKKDRERYDATVKLINDILTKLEETGKGAGGMEETVGQIGKLSAEINSAQTESEVTKKVALLSAANSRLQDLRATRSELLQQLGKARDDLKEHEKEIASTKGRQEMEEAATDAQNRNIEMTTIPR